MGALPRLKPCRLWRPAAQSRGPAALGSVVCCAVLQREALEKARLSQNPGGSTWFCDYCLLAWGTWKVKGRGLFFETYKIYSLPL